MRMRHNAILSLWGLLVFIGTSQADTVIGQQQPTVVYEGSSTISAGPYYQRLSAGRSRSGSDVSIPEGMGNLALEDRLPLPTGSLRVGQPQMKAVPGLITPLFIMGMDEVSLTWFRQAADGLVDIGARGIVVQASSKSAWLDLQGRAQAAGIDLILLQGDAIARGYGINTYPTVLMGPAPAGEGADE